MGQIPKVTMKSLDQNPSPSNTSIFVIPYNLPGVLKEAKEAQSQMSPFIFRDQIQAKIGRKKEKETKGGREGKNRKGNISYKNYFTANRMLFVLAIY